MRPDAAQRGRGAGDRPARGVAHRAHAARAAVRGRDRGRPRGRRARPRARRCRRSRRSPGSSEARVADATGALARAEILRPEAPLGFVHALVRDAVYQELPLGERELQHERAARVLLDAGAPPEQVAAHLLTAPRRGQEWVVDAAARGAAAPPWRAARRRAASRICGARWRSRRRPRGGRSCCCELGLAEVLMDGRAAIGHLTEAYETLEDTAARALVAHALCRALLFTGSPAEAARVRPARRRRAARRARRGRAASSTAFDLMTGFFGVDAPERLRALEAHRDPPGRDGRPRRQDARGRAALWWAYTGGGADECAELGARGARRRRADRRRQRADDDGGDADARAGRPPRGGHGVGDRAVRGAPSRLAARDLVDPPVARLHAAPVRRAGGGRGVAALGAGGVRRMGVRPGRAPLHAARSSRAALLERGRLDEARACARPRAPSRDENSEGSRYWRCARAGAAASPRGATTEALERVRGLRAPPRATCGCPTATSRALARRARARPARPRPTRRSRSPRRSWPTRARWGAPGTVGPSLRVLGDAAARGRDGAAARRRSTVLERSHARARARQGARRPRLRAAPRRGGPSDAREPLRRALELADACGADALVEHVRSELYATGARPRTTALGGVDALTASERRVAAFAAEGQSNRDIAQALFVTPKTVEVHLSQRLPQARDPLAPRPRRQRSRAIESLGTAFRGHPDGGRRPVAPSCPA